MLTKSDLDEIAARANAAIADVHALWNWPNPPAVTPGIVAEVIDAFLEVQQNRANQRVLNLPTFDGETPGTGLASMPLPGLDSDARVVMSIVENGQVVTPSAAPLEGAETRPVTPPSTPMPAPLRIPDDTQTDLCIKNEQISSTNSTATDTLLAAVGAALRAMAGPSGIMPSQLEWDRARPVGLPSHAHLIRLLRLASWHELPALTGLKPRPSPVKSAEHMAALRAKARAVRAARRLAANQQQLNANDAEDANGANGAKEQQDFSLPLASSAPLALSSSPPTHDDIRQALAIPAPSRPLPPHQRAIWDSLHAAAVDGYLPAVWEWNRDKPAAAPTIAMILGTLNLSTTRQLAAWAGLKFREPAETVNGGAS